MTLHIASISLIYLILVFHWYTEIKDQLILDIPNFLLFTIGVVRLIYINPNEVWWHVSGFLLAMIVPYIVFRLGGHFGGGTYKLLMVSGLILGFGQIAITLLFTPLIYRAYVSLCEKYSWRRYPSGVSVLFFVPFQVLYLYLTTGN